MIYPATFLNDSRFASKYSLNLDNLSGLFFTRNEKISENFEKDINIIQSIFSIFVSTNLEQIAGISSQLVHRIDFVIQ